MEKNNQILDYTLLDDILESIGDVTQCDLIPILQQIQDKYGYLPREILTETSKRTAIPLSDIYGVATFYEQFHLDRRGRHIVKCCRGTACHVKGGNEIINTIQRMLDVEDGDTTEDFAFTFETVACLGACALAPLVVIDDVYYGKMTPNKISEIIDELRKAYMEKLT